MTFFENLLKQAEIDENKKFCLVSFTEKKRMQFISISDLEALTGSEIKPDSPSGFSAILEKLEDFVDSGEFTISGIKYDINEVRVYLNRLDSKKLVFHDWVDQHTELKDLLLGKSPEKRFEDKFKWVKHSLFNEFKTFLSPFLQ